MNKMQTVEIGSVKEIDVERIRFVYHRSGNPAEEALMLKELMDKGMNQHDVAQLLGVHPAHISRRLRLLNLTEALFKRVLAGEIKARTGYQLARLPKEKQAEYEGLEKVTMKAAESAVREFVLNEDVVALIKEDTVIDFDSGPTPAVLLTKYDLKDWEMTVVTSPRGDILFVMPKVPGIDNHALLNKKIREAGEMK